MKGSKYFSDHMFSYTFGKKVCCFTWSERSACVTQIFYCLWSNEIGNMHVQKQERNELKTFCQFGSGFKCNYIVMTPKSIAGLSQCFCQKA